MTKTDVRGVATNYVYDASAKLVAEYSIIVEPQSTAKVSYLTNDTLGSPRITTDQNGQVISRRDFQPYGEEIFSPQRTQALGYTADTIRQKFTGYERDNETSLDYAKARIFGSGYGRFTSPDPLMASAKRAIPQSWNRYTYVLNNPLKYVDPSGMAWGVSKDGQTFCYLPGKAVCNGFTRVPYGTIVENPTRFGKSLGFAIRLTETGYEQVVPVDIQGVGRSWLNPKDADAINAITGGALCSLSAGTFCPNKGEKIADNVQAAADTVQMVFVLKTLLKAGLTFTAIATVLRKDTDDVVKLIKGMTQAELNEILATQKDEIKALFGQGQAGADASLELLKSGKMPPGAESLSRETLEAYKEVAIRAIDKNASTRSVSVQRTRLEIVQRMIDNIPQ